MVALPNQLVALLHRAAAEMLAAGEAFYLGKHDTCAGLGRFISASTEALVSGDSLAAKELWFVFAPTCDWDDAGGSLDLANTIFELLDQVYSPAVSDGVRSRAAAR
jgi:hypothetical protein